jgi:hypothetical protein
MTRRPDATLERISLRIPIPEPAYERLLRRRDRKRRNQRLLAGCVAIAVFVSAVLLLANGPLHSTHRPVATPTTGASLSTDDQFWPDGGFDGLPPDGTTPSDPLQGEVLVRDGGIHPWWKVYVYTDGRVIWLHEGWAGNRWLERRLTPEGVDLLRSRPDLAGRIRALPATAWGDTRAVQYVPARYLVCTSQETIPRLPQAAQDLLADYTDEKAVERGEVGFSAGGRGSTCPVVTIDEARRLDQILREAGFREGEDAGYLDYHSRDLDAYLSVIPLLPNGDFGECCPG